MSLKTHSTESHGWAGHDRKSSIPGVHGSENPGKLRTRALIFTFAARQPSIVRSILRLQIHPSSLGSLARCSLTVECARMRLCQENRAAVSSYAHLSR